MTSAGEPIAEPGRERIAVTVIGGYLGSGKTTLVNHILVEATERIVVLVNDFGDINIDVDLITSRGENTMELANGCICCSLVDGFAAALDTIIELDPLPDRLVIEASGVSDPAQVAAYGHGPGLAMDAVVVLVDAETVRDRVLDKYVGQTVSEQLDSAHVVVVNKADLVDEEQLAETVAWVQGRCPDAFVTTTTQSQVPPEVLFGRAAATVGDQPTHTHSHAHTDHTDVFRTWSIERDQPMSRADVEALMDGLDDTVVRAKGFVWLDDSPDKPGVLQRVGRRWTLRKTGEWPGEPATRIVLIEVATDEQATT